MGAGATHVPAREPQNLLLRLLELLLVGLAPRTDVLEVALRLVEPLLELVVLGDEAAHQVERLGLVRRLHAQPLGVQGVELQGSRTQRELTRLMRERRTHLLLADLL